MPEGLSEPLVCMPLSHSYGQWTGKIEGKISNLASRNTASIIPACVQLPNENAKPDKCQAGPLLARGKYTSMCVVMFPSRQTRNFTQCVFACAVRWLKLWGQSWAVTVALSVLWHVWFMSSSITTSPFPVEGEEWDPAFWISSLYSPSIIWFWDFRFIIILLLVMFFFFFSPLSFWISANPSMQSSVRQGGNKATHSEE